MTDTMYKVKCSCENELHYSSWQNTVTAAVQEWWARYRTSMERNRNLDPRGMWDQSFSLHIPTVYSEKLV